MYCILRFSFLFMILFLRGGEVRLVSGRLLRMLESLFFFFFLSFLRRDGESKGYLEDKCPLRSRFQWQLEDASVADRLIIVIAT